MSADQPDLTPPARRALDYYREMAEAVRRSAAIERGQASHRDPAARLAAMTKADRLDADAAQWDALADELTAFAERVAERQHDGQGALL